MDGCAVYGLPVLADFVGVQCPDGVLRGDGDVGVEVVELTADVECKRLACDGVYFRFVLLPQGVPTVLLCQPADGAA